ncbi:MAG TPA: GGDEF domain-containing protein [Thermoanaerobaculia bacterium]|jgi:diguanylate cyclase (GGDEF)-like protein|nr:GGDEF domain-containing protein [Thermoanaerobaculia bacterium]
MASDASNSRRTPRPLLPPRLLGLAIGIGGSALAVLVWWLSSDALGRDAIVPWVVLGGGLLLAWGLALSFGMAASARERADEGLEEKQRLEAELAELAERARHADSLRREVDSYRQLFDTGEHAKVVPKLPAVPVKALPAEPPLHESLRDPLTGLFHRRYFEASLGREIHRMERRNLILGVLLLQVDSYDTIVEIRGQESADAMLQTLAELLKRRVRGGDVASHNGRGEFGLILPEAPLEGVRTRAEQLRAAVKEMRARSGDDPPASFTLSFGVAAYPESGLTFERLLRALRDALEQSASEGGDRVSVAPGAVLDRRLMLPD